MKKLILCGDSNLSPRTDCPGTHFSEIFCSKLNFNLITYARSAISNGAIVLQIEQAIQDKPDLIILNFTQSDRIEFKHQDQNIDHRITIKDISYTSFNSDLSSRTNNFSGNLFSDNLVSLLSMSDETAQQHKLSKTKLNAIDTYFRELYSHTWKHKIDCMSIYYAFHQLHKNNIPFLIYQCAFDFNLDLRVDWIPEHYNICNEIRELYGNEKLKKDPGYHTSFETQEKIAEFVIQHYNKYFSNVN
mgnify:CR=1 FL=1